MCGRFARTSAIPVFASALGGDPGITATATTVALFTPGMAVTAFRRDPGGHRISADPLGWGYHPWQAGPKAPTPINARAETAARSAWFRDAFRHRRCLVPADGWLEWQAADDGGRQPWYFSHAAGAPLFLAALWAPRLPPEHPGDGRPADGLAIVTEPARGAAAAVHPRMPVVLTDRDSLLAWLDPALTHRADLRRRIRHTAMDDLRQWPVSRALNRAGADAADLLIPLPARPADPDAPPTGSAARPVPVRPAVPASGPPSRGRPAPARAVARPQRPPSPPADHAAVRHAPGPPARD